MTNKHMTLGTFKIPTMVITPKQINFVIILVALLINNATWRSFGNYLIENFSVLECLLCVSGGNTCIIIYVRICRLVQGLQFKLCPALWFVRWITIIIIILLNLGQNLHVHNIHSRGFLDPRFNWVSPSSWSLSLSLSLVMSL